MVDRYARQAALPQVGPSGQQKLRESTVALVGMGALGCVQAAFLARSGIGSMVLIDRDFVEVENLQRQILYTEEDARAAVPKAEAARRHLQEANGEISIRAFVAHLGKDNARELLDGTDLILDGVDNFETRFLVNDYSIATGTPWIYGACVGMEGTISPILPRKTPCLRCRIAPEPLPEEPSCASAGVLGPVAGMVGSLQAAAAIRLLLEGEKGIPWGALRVEAWSGAVATVAPSPPDPLCAACTGGKLEFLEGPRSAATEILCGREAVQILPRRRATRSLSAAAAALSGHGEVFLNTHILRARIQGCVFSVFRDGRVIVTGTSDPGRAKALVDRYLADF
jgi:adenylyltransferase/sulfurtransferase